jgi:PAS domain S-box-containing protein
VANPEARRQPPAGAAQGGGAPVTRDRPQLGARAAELSRADLRAIVDSLGEPVITVDQTQTIVFANHAAMRMFGDLDLIGQPLERVIPGGLGELRDRDRLALVSHDGRPQRGHDVIGVRADAAELALQASVSAVTVDGALLCSAVLREMTDDRTALRELRARMATLAASQAALRRLVASQEREAEAERRRIARSLHDDLAQTLAMLSITIGIAGRSLADNPGRVATLLADAGVLTKDVVGSARRLITELRPLGLEEFGLAEALRLLCTDLADRSGIECDVALEEPGDDPERADPDIAACLYRVAAAATVDAEARDARWVRLTLARAPGDRLALTVSDDGVAIQDAEPRRRSGPGQAGLTERVLAVGGEIDVTSEPGGTTITVLAPRGGLGITADAQGDVATGARGGEH